VRVVVLVVVACGCRVGTSSPVDATTPRGDGLVERVTIDAALWADVRIPDVAVDLSARDQNADARTDIPDAAADVIDPTDTGVACSLLTISCPDRRACYPYPFEGVPTGETRCAFQGAGGPSVPCQSQLECDGTSVCASPGQPDSSCLQRCNPADARCPAGTACVAFENYPTTGVCR
jgi:hypothetical protein